jgi:hypothetical protein
MSYSGLIFLAFYIDLNKEMRKQHSQQQTKTDIAKIAKEHDIRNPEKVLTKLSEKVYLFYP